MPAAPNPKTPAAPAVVAAPRPQLTIVLSTYNRARWLDRYFDLHLDGLETTGLDFELVVFDDGSSDGAGDVIERRTAGHPRVRRLTHVDHLGPTGGILFGARQARGEFLVVVPDDDALVPEVLTRYVARLAADPDLAMVQAPWTLTDETRDHAALGQFYSIPAERRFARGEHGACLEFLLQHHVFPETFITRTAVAGEVFEAVHPFVFPVFAQLARALAAGDVLFAPEPFHRVTAISAVEDSRLGNREAMDSWDRYRGGIEYFASFALPNGPTSQEQLTALVRSFQGFTATRMRVAARLHVAAQNWGNAYHLERRLRCYGVSNFDDGLRAVVAGLAAIESIIAEARLQGAKAVVLDDRFEDDTLANLAPDLRAMVARIADPVAASDTPKAFVLFDAPPPNLAGPNDVFVDAAAAFRRYPV